MKPEDFPKESEKGRRRYVLGEFELEPDTLRLSRQGEVVHLTRKPFQVLTYLVERHERLVSRAELLEAFWGRDDVYDETLTKCISAIRKALGDSQEQPRFILTHWAEGYRYIGPVAESLPVRLPVATQLAEPRVPATRYRMVTAVVLLLAGVLASLYFVTDRVRSMPTASRASIRSVAVLPLRNLSPNSDDDYLSDGLTEDLVTALSRLQDLRVLSRGSVARDKGRDSDPQEAGSRLDVAAVIEGSVRHEAERIHVAIRLVDAGDGRILWSDEAIGQTARDILQLEPGLVRGLAARLRGVAAAGRAPEVSRRMANPDASVQYLRGRYFLDKRTVAFARRGLECFQEAIRLDPVDALSYSGLADAYLKLGALGGLTPPEALRQAGPAASRAVELDDELSEAHRTLATIAIIRDFDWRRAEQEFRRAIELDPNSAAAHQDHAFFVMSQGRADEALSEMQLALALDPLSVVVNRDLGEMFYERREYGRATTQFLTGLELDPHYLTLYRWLVYAYEKQGRFDDAVDSDLKRQALLGSTDQEIATLRALYTTQGWHAYWRNRLAAEQAAVPSVPPLLMASMYVRLGDVDQAFAWLEKAYRDHSFSVTEINQTPMFETLRSDPRFTALVKRLGLGASLPSALYREDKLSQP